MVDFSKRLGRRRSEIKVNPFEIYDSLDRRSVTGPLRPEVNKILKEWTDSERMDYCLTLAKIFKTYGKTKISIAPANDKNNEISASQV
ncbi:MAG: hypothetical protein NTW49_13930 [Bacteroidia bacterium]|nr:hypothetical protein [Bacteroidia bacterium]